MADMLAPDAAPEVLALADQIRVTQLREIGHMTGWLQLAGASVVSPRPMAWMMADAGHHTVLAACRCPALRHRQTCTGYNGPQAAPTKSCSCNS